MQFSVSAAAERNKGPILEVISHEFARCAGVLEIGSGTGQHALHFAAGLPHLCWQPSETPENLAPLRERLRLTGSENLRAPLELDVRMDPWPVERVEGIFSANTLHIMSYSCVEQFFRGAGAILVTGGVLCVYGPFRYDGRYTSESNLIFDNYLRQRDPDSGIREFESVDALATQRGLTLVGDHRMPANNQLLVYRRLGSGNSSNRTGQ